MGNFIGNVTISNATPKNLKQLILEAIDARFTGKTAAQKSAYLADYLKWVADELFLSPQGGDIIVCDNYLAIQNNTNLSGIGTNVTAADMAVFGTVIPDGTTKHYQKGIAAHNILIISPINNFKLDVDLMNEEL